jgi:hypothetical protein
MDSRRVTYLMLLPLCLLPLAGCASQNYETRPFYQKEIATETHGKKTLFDRIVETDPGGLEVTMAKDYEERPPATIAVLPFNDRGTAQYVVDKIPLSFRNRQQRNQWAWTDSQRLRKAFVAYFSEREFTVVNPIAVDAVLKSHGINNEEELEKVSVLTLGKWFNCDAVMYGTVEDYDAYYFGLVSGFVVGVDARMVSTHDGETLMRGEGARYSLNVMPALDAEDIIINSAESLLQLRDVELARAEEEVARELVIRIPPSETLRAQLAANAVRKAREAEAADEEAMNYHPPIVASTTPYVAPPPSAEEVQFLQAAATGDDQETAPAEQRAVDQERPHPNTASSWQMPGSQRVVSYSSPLQH